MSPLGQQILQCLHAVNHERQRRAQDAVLARRVQRIKQFQQARFESTYAELMANPRYAAAARFFLRDLYGPEDFTRRDEEFARIVPPLTRLFPREVVETVHALSQLHALSEQLDTAMAEHIDDRPLDGASYALAWRSVGREADRERQVVLMLQVGSALEHYTHNALLRHSLRLMRGPAQTAGLGALQRFLETGFETFRAMGGAAEFLDTIARRERTLSAALFAGGDVPGATRVL
jgi:hypothetical protein